VLWRVCSDGFYIYFAPDGTLDPQFYMSHLNRALDDDSYIVMKNAAQLRNIDHLSLMKDLAVFTSFLKGTFEVAGLSLNYFNPSMGKVAAYPEHQGKMQFAISLTSVQYALVGIYNEAFTGCFAKVLDGLQVRIAQYATVSNDYM
jgi:hypothetical protein